MPLIRKLLESQALPNDSEALGQTLERFLSSGPPSLIENDGGGQAQALEALLKTIHESFAPAVVNGTQLLDQLQRSRLLPTGCLSIDTELLRGGLREGQLTELCGESASGKTQLCLMAVAETAARGEAVVYVDTSNAFTAARLLQMLRGPVARAAAAGRGVLRAEDALARVMVHRAYDIHSLLAALDSLLRLPRERSPSLVVIDSLSAVVAPVLGGGGGQHSQGHVLLAGAGVLLKALAVHAKAAVLVTNHMVGGGEGRRGEKRPAMGESWKSQPHVRLQLSLAAAPGSAAGPQRQQEAGTRGQQHVATLRASTFSATGAQALYWLTAEGVVSEAPGPPAAAAMG